MEGHVPGIPSSNIIVCYYPFTNGITWIAIWEVWCKQTHHVLLIKQSTTAYKYKTICLVHVTEKPSANNMAILNRKVSHYIHVQSFKTSGSGSVLISQEALTGVFYVSPMEEGPTKMVGQTGRQTCDSKVIPMSQCVTMGARFYS